MRLSLHLVSFMALPNYFGTNNMPCYDKDKVSLSLPNIVRKSLIN